MLLLLLFALIPWSLTAWIEPQLTIYSSYNTTLEASTVSIFSTQGTFLPSSNNTYYWLFQFDEFISGQSQFTVVNSSKPPIINYVYTTTGAKCPNVTVSDNPFVPLPSSFLSSETGIPFSVLSNQQPAAFVSRCITIFPQSACYALDVSIDWTNSLSMQLFSVWISIIDPSSPSKRSAYLTDTFASLGKNPSVILFNDTNSYSHTLSSSLVQDKWQLILSVDVAMSNSPMFLTVDTSNLHVLGCAVASQTVQVMVPYLKFHSLGTPFSHTETSPGLVLKNSQYFPLSIKHIKGRCYTGNEIILMFLNSSLPTPDYLGALLLASSDGFINDIQLQTLLKTSLQGNSKGGESLCFGLDSNHCRQIKLYDAALTLDRILLLTSRGLYISSPFSGIQGRALELTRLITNQPNVDVVSNQSMGIRAFVKEDCTLVEVVQFIVYSSSVFGDSVLKVINQIGSNTLFNKGFVLSNVITAPYQHHSIVSATHSYDRGISLYLVGHLNTSDPLNQDCISKVCRYTNAVILQEDEYENILIAFIFPENEGVTGMEIGVLTQDILVYGDNVWISVDVGQSFYIYSQMNFVNSEMFSQLSLSYGSEKIVAMTNQGNVYYSKMVSHQILQMHYSNNNSTLNIANLLLTDELYLIQIFPLLNYTDNTNDYPVGFLMDPQGNMLPQQDLLVRNLVPETTSGELRLLKNKPALVPVRVSLSQTKFFTYPYGSNYFFDGDMDKVVVGNGGTSSIVNFVDTQSTFLSTVGEQTLFSGKIASVALLYDLVVVDKSTLQPIIPSTISVDSSPPLTSVFLVLQNVGLDGWFYSDVEKTVVLGKGSIIISNVINSTVAEGIIYSSLIQTGANSNEWNLLDYRSRIISEVSMNQTLLVKNTGQSLADITLTNGLFFFQVFDTGKGLLLGNGFGIINLVYNSSTARVAVFNPISDGTYPAADWQIVELSKDYVFGSSAPLMNAAWGYAFQSCPWSSFEANISSTYKYLSYGDSITFGVSLTISPENIQDVLINYYSSLSVLAFNPYNVGSEVVIYKPSTLETNLTLSVMDRLKLGQSSWCISPKFTSPFCDTNRFCLKILNRCSGASFLKFHPPMTNQQLNDFFGNIGVSAYESLPVNYRPPSPLGIAVPTTENIYNADPSQPMYNNYFTVSKESGKYKSCLGASNRSECQCQVFQESSMQATDSDCITQAPRAVYSIPYSPSFQISQDGLVTSSFTSQMVLTEINNRTDFCISSDGVNCMSDVRTASQPFVPSQFILWKGSELFHFQASVYNYTYCVLSDDFLVFVVYPPLDLSVYLVVVTSTCIAFCLWMMVTYLFHNYKTT